MKIKEMAVSHITGKEVCREITLAAMFDLIEWIKNVYEHEIAYLDGGNTIEIKTFDKGAPCATFLFKAE